MGKEPAFQFYPGDWVQDTRILSLEAKGAWIDILCAMWRSQTRGSITLPYSGFCRLIGANMEQTKSAIQELTDLQICQFETEPNGDITLICRRMKREDDERQNNAERQKKWYYRNKEKGSNCEPNKPCNDIPNGNSDTNLTTLSSSSSSSSINIHPPTPLKGDFTETKKRLDDSHPNGAVVLTFPCEGKEPLWTLTESKVAEWRELFPSVDIMGECRHALAWVKAKPDRKKTSRGMEKFLVDWFGRSKNKGNGTTRGSPAVPLRTAGIDEEERSEIAKTRERLIYRIDATKPMEGIIPDDGKSVF